MSCAILIVPAVMAAWPVLLPILTAAAAACGYVSAERAEARERVRGRRRGKSADEVEVSLEQSEVLAEAMQRDTTFTASKGDIRVTVSRDIRGQLRVSASGANVAKDVLRREAETLTNSIVQQYAYHKLMTQLKERGFQVTRESVTEDRRIRLTVRRHR